MVALTSAAQALTVLAVLAGTPQAQPMPGLQPPMPRHVKVTVVVILASEKNEEVDERLTCIAEEVRKRNPQLKGFKLASMTSQSLAVDQQFTFNLVQEATALVTVKQSADTQNKVQLAITAPLQGEIVYRTVCGKFLPIVTRYQTKDRERLILAVRVQPCNGGK